MANTIEILHHFSCKKCSGWWSLAATSFLKPRMWHCPWCGDESFYEMDNLEVDDGTGTMGGEIPPQKH